MVALSAGADRWREVDLPAFEAQASLTRGFWMSYHELTGGYPWLTKRVARVLHPDAALPARNAFAYLLALFSPYMGRGGGALGIIVLAAVLGILAAIGIPAIATTTRSRLTPAHTSSEPALGACRLVRRAQGAARPLEEAGVPRRSPTSQLARAREHGPHRRGRAAPSFAPEERADGTVAWHCSGGVGVRAAQRRRSARGRRRAEWQRRVRLRCVRTINSGWEPAKTSPFRSTAVVGAAPSAASSARCSPAPGHPVTLIGGPAHERSTVGPPCRWPAASSDPHPAAPGHRRGCGADLVLFCVKSTDPEIARARWRRNPATARCPHPRTASRTRRRSRATCAGGRSRGRLRRHGDALPGLVPTTVAATSSSGRSMPRRRRMRRWPRACRRWSTCSRPRRCPSASRPT
jgi:hypothetical protein